jgi:Flp pilus assembly protein TadG
MSVCGAATRCFGRERRGNFGVTVALVCVPLVYVVGCGVDCCRVAQLRSQLQAAANAASTGSIAKVSPALLAARVMTLDGPVALGAADAADIFNAGMSGVTGYTLDSMIATVTKQGATLTAEVTFSAHVRTAFLRLIGRPAVTIGGAATATTRLPRFIDVYVSPRQFAGADPGAGSHTRELQ